MQLVLAVRVKRTARVLLVVAIDFVQSLALLVELAQTRRMSTNDGTSVRANTSTRRGTGTITGPSSTIDRRLHVNCRLYVSLPANSTTCLNCDYMCLRLRPHV